ncbi:hypothetical protein PV328_002379 [Microctonus aethiopoides]|uniref:Vesicle transport protein USE1 n=1 Tax=Microctonus aethiopoides TaxID=144406 RepID=A0AA39FZP8_9HYME|nr:hypothetical protein PV328_002379 [Microctonus aethiopoides]
MFNQKERNLAKKDSISCKSRIEVNIKRLLTRCELLAKEDSHHNWRLEKYIHALDGAMTKLQLSNDKPSKDEMAEYMKRIDFLKGIIDMEKLNNPIERVVAVQLLPNFSKLNSNEPNIVTQIHQKTVAKYNRELRSELLNCDSDGKTRMRMSSISTHDGDLDALLKYNRNMQEKIAENMILMTSNMKEHALTAGAIIRKDMVALEKSDKLTEINTTKLKAESLKLEEHTKSNWRCWVWLMVALVLTIFFSKKYA